MRGELPKREPELLARWEEMGLYAPAARGGEGAARSSCCTTGRPTPTATSISATRSTRSSRTSINRSQQMMGKDAPYVPGWDCHGLPIEWKIEEEYRAKGKNKDEVPVVEFRRECRDFARALDRACRRRSSSASASTAIGNDPYTTMDFAAEAQIARELMKFAANGLLYRGSKPVMWSVVEKTALAEAEVEYEDYVSDQVWVKFPVRGAATAAVVIWTTTPWTLPGQSRDLVLVEDQLRALRGHRRAGRQLGQDRRQADPRRRARRRGDEAGARRCVSTLRPTSIRAGSPAAHPLAKLGYGFKVPLLAGDHVTDDTGTGFVHTAPGHGATISRSGRQMRARLPRAASTRRSPTRWTATGSSPTQAPGLQGQACHHRQGREGRRQRGGDRGAARRRHAASRARGSRTSIRTPGAPRSR